MSDDSKKTSIGIDPDVAEEADQLAAYLSEINGFKVSRSAVARRAIHELFLRLRPSFTTDVVPESKVAA